jgi:predicted peptidase
MVARLSRLVTELIGSYNLDPGRVYVTGFSMGGDGTWALGIAHPEQFAALLPVSRWYRKYDLVCALKALPVHVYQSELDEVVPAPIAKKMTADLEVCGGNVQLTLFPEGRHNETCGIAYARDEIYQWLDAQKKE